MRTPLTPLGLFGAPAGTVLVACSDEPCRQPTSFIGGALGNSGVVPGALHSPIRATVPGGLPVHDFDHTIPPPECG